MTGDRQYSRSELLLAIRQERHSLTRELTEIRRDIKRLLLRQDEVDQRLVALSDSEELLTAWRQQGEE